MSTVRSTSSTADTTRQTGFELNFMSLRATAVVFSILNSPDLNLQVIARTAGTSVAVIDEFYAKRPTAEMNKDVLCSIPKRKSGKSRCTAANAAVGSAAEGTR
jgi:hypothetical protein